MLAWRKVPPWQRLLWLDEMTKLRQAALRGRRLKHYQRARAQGR
jgi:hypothetical protein